MIQAKSVNGISESESRRDLNINPFNRDARVYCAICSCRKNWKKVEEIGFHGDDRQSFYEFQCHGDSVIIETKRFIQNHRIQGPVHKSYLVFNDANDQEKI